MKRTKKMMAILLASMLLSTHMLSLGSVVIAEGENTTNGVTSELQLETPIEERVTRAELSIDDDKKNLSTIVENKNVEMKVVLDTSSTNYALYKNPTFEIEMPIEIETVTLNNVTLVLEDELTLGQTSVVTRDGKQVIHIALQGEQTKYFNNTSQAAQSNHVIAKGANIVINANITVKQLSPSKTEQVVLYYTNDNTNLYEYTQVNHTQTGLQLVGENAEGTKGVTIDEIYLVAPSGVTTATTITGYNETEKLVNLTNEEKQIKVNTYSQKKTLTVTGTIMNNDENNMQQIMVLGRVPSKETTQFDSNESLGSTFNLKLLSELTVTGIASNKVTIYYSENGAATKDLTNSQNAWKTEPESLAAVKSYLIIIDPTTELNQAEQISFTYTAELPANLPYNQTAVHTYQVTYQSMVQEAILSTTKTAGVIEITTGEGAELEVKLEPTTTIVREGQIVKMKATITNIGKLTAENVKITIPLPEYATFVDYVVGNGFYPNNEEEKTIEIGSLQPNEVMTIAYYVKIENDTAILPAIVEDGEHDDDEQYEEELTEEQAQKIQEEAEQAQKALTYPKEVIYQVNSSCNNISSKIYSNEYKMQIQKGTIALAMYSDVPEELVLKKADEIQYLIDVTNIAKGGNLKNTTVTIPLPEGIKYVNAYVKDAWDKGETITEGVSYQESTNTVTIQLGELELTKLIVLQVEIDTAVGNIEVYASAVAEGTDKHYSNITQYLVEKPQIELSTLTSTPKYVNEGETITYRFTITNKGQSTVYGIKIQDILPTELIYEKTTYTYLDQEEIDSNIEDQAATIYINQLAGKSSINITLTAVAGLLVNLADKEIQNKITVSANEIEDLSTNTVTNIIEYHQSIHEQLIQQEGNILPDTPGAPDITNPEDPSNPSENPSNPSQSETYKITGTAWLDSNQNGQREESEELLTNVKVMLIYKENNQIVKDNHTNEQKIVTTNENGAYEFSNLEPNEYLVIFLYDAGKYSITAYQKEGVDESLNSDAINLKITLDGEELYAGVANTIKITNSNARDIDIGLYVAKKFDLRLDKYISKMTLTTPTIGTRITTYENSKLEKTEILARNVGKSSIVVEYKIVVTNEGQVPGYATKLIDYLPEEMKFSSELNPTWYASDNNHTVYNTSLAQTKLQPGESKEVTLILSLNINEKNMGATISNRAEIYESYNEQGIEDLDSMPANILESEDDFSKADIVISLVTGRIIMYTVLTLVIVAILITGIIIIKKKVFI